MFKDTPAFSGFSVNDLAAAHAFYQDVLGLDVGDNGMGLDIKLGDGGNAFAYAKPDHVPATFTILNFVVEDIDAAVDALAAQGVTFERYEGVEQDEKGIARDKAADMGPDIAWFTDPAGNILSVLQN